MPIHEVSLLGLVEESGDRFTGSPDSTRGFIEVRPPITVGAKFGSVILGQDQYGVTIQEVGSTSEVTILSAEVAVHGLDSEARQGQIRAISQRVMDFVIDPTRSLEMFQENPFPAPQEDRPF